MKILLREQFVESLESKTLLLSGKPLDILPLNFDLEIESTSLSPQHVFRKMFQVHFAVVPLSAPRHELLVC